MTYRKLYLAKNKEASLERKHPWIFSGAIHHEDKNIENGEVVEIQSFNGEIMATGHYQKGSIICRILHFGSAQVDRHFFAEKFTLASSYRREILHLPSDHTNAYRLIHGEGDGLPGLIIDIYNKTAVIQCHSVGMARSLDEIVEGLKLTQGISINTIYNRSKEEGVSGSKEGHLWGKEVNEDWILENGKSFIVNWAEGQKTGFFLDQRENRTLLGLLSKNKAVLNLFAYSGGFSLYALDAGATEVTSMDISSKATALIDRNIAQSNFQDRHTTITDNVIEYLKSYEGQLPFDIIVVDPPAFAKTLSKRHNAVQGYKRLNEMVIHKSKPNTIILTYSCSQVVDQPLFHHTITAAAIGSGRNIRILKQMSQGPDHPINLYHPEGHYLKGLMLLVED